jgi:hypothetical protein
LDDFDAGFGGFVVWAENHVGAEIADDEAVDHLLDGPMLTADSVVLMLDDFEALLRGWLGYIDDEVGGGGFEGVITFELVFYFNGLELPIGNKECAIPVSHGDCVGVGGAEQE